MKRLALAAAALLVAALVAVGVLVARGSTGESIPAAEDNRVRPAPALSGTDPVTGKPVSLAAFAGKPVVINVWASWCPPCHDEAPDLARFASLHPEAQVLGIDIRDSRQGAKAFYRQYRWTHPSIFDPSGELALSLGIPGQPVTYFLNARHEIVGEILGASDLAGFEAGLERAVDG